MIAINYIERIKAKTKSWGNPKYDFLTGEVDIHGEKVKFKGEGQGSLEPEKSQNKDFSPPLLRALISFIVDLRPLTNKYSFKISTRCTTNIRDQFLFRFLTFSGYHWGSPLIWLYLEYF